MKITRKQADYLKNNGIKLTAIIKGGKLQAYRAYNPMEPFSFYFIGISAMLKFRLVGLIKAYKDACNFPFLENCYSSDCYYDEIEWLKKELKAKRAKRGE